MVYVTSISAVQNLRANADEAVVTIRGNLRTRAVCIIAENKEIAQYLAVGYAYSLWPPDDGWGNHVADMFEILDGVFEDTGPTIVDGDREVPS